MMKTKIEKKRISILGCGWLGFPLAQRLRELNISSEVKGSTTSPHKLALFEEKGIIPYQLDFTPEFSGNPDRLDSFLDTDLLIISIPPKMAKTGQDFHVKQIESVIKKVREAPVKEIIYISSTSIYPELNRLVTESDVITPGQSAAPAMVTAENLLAELKPKKMVTILRLGGLLGYDRIPGKYVKGQKDMTTGDIPVNYIHRDDAVGIIAKILETDLVNETFNIVAPNHPPRAAVYTASCNQFGWEVPTFKNPDVDPGFKTISAQKFSKFYQYEFKYPDPLEFHYELSE